jgi:hypothetical protein
MLSIVAIYFFKCAKCVEQTTRVRLENLSSKPVDDSFLTIDFIYTLWIGKLWKQRLALETQLHNLKATAPWLPFKSGQKVSIVQLWPHMFPWPDPKNKKL